MGEYSFGLHFFRSAIAGHPYCTGFVRPNSHLEIGSAPRRTEAGYTERYQRFCSTMDGGEGQRFLKGSGWAVQLSSETGFLCYVNCTDS